MTIRKRPAAAPEGPTVCRGPLRGRKTLSEALDRAVEMGHGCVYVVSYWSPYTREMAIHMQSAIRPLVIPVEDESMIAAAKTWVAENGEIPVWTTLRGELEQVRLWSV